MGIVVFNRILVNHVAGVLVIYDQLGDVSNVQEG